jgi:integrase
VVHVCFAHHQFSLASEPVKGLNSRLTTGWLNQRVGRRTESHLQLSLITVIRARKSKRLPVVFTRAEVKTVLDQMHGEQRLIAVLMYGTGMRLMECLLCLPKSASGL